MKTPWEGALSKTIVIPDIHGCLTLLDKALAWVSSRRPDKVVFLGDYIDRGLCSAQVVARIRAGIADGKPWVALKGNHEDFMASSVCDADESMRWSWMLNGGRETVESYHGDEAAIKSDAEWMKSLPVYHEGPQHIFVHAFAPEQHDLADAPQGSMLWTRYPQGTDIGYRGRHVVHGHTPQRNGPELLVNRTNLDCGAVFYGILAAAEFDDATPGGPSHVEIIK
jgi:serine/threonine protein phosphatase 1